MNKCVCKKIKSEQNNMQKSSDNGYLASEQEKTSILVQISFWSVWTMKMNLMFFKILKEHCDLNASQMFFRSSKEITITRLISLDCTGDCLELPNPSLIPWQWSYLQSDSWHCRAVVMPRLRRNIWLSSLFACLKIMVDGWTLSYFGGGDIQCLHCMLARFDEFKMMDLDLITRHNRLQ